MIGFLFLAVVLGAIPPTNPPPERPLTREEVASVVARLRTAQRQARGHRRPQFVLTCADMHGEPCADAQAALASLPLDRVIRGDPVYPTTCRPLSPTDPNARVCSPAEPLDLRAYRLLIPNTQHPGETWAVDVAPGAHPATIALRSTLIVFEPC